jgi:hypothetical protein
MGAPYWKTKHTHCPCTSAPVFGNTGCFFFAMRARSTEISLSRSPIRESRSLTVARYRRSRCSAVHDGVSGRRARRDRMTVNSCAVYGSMGIL